jgi:hypothetical protein
MQSTSSGGAVSELSAVHEAEALFPVGSWSARGVHLWPFLRCALYSAAVDTSVGLVARGGRGSRARDVLRRVASTGGCVVRQRAALADGMESRPLPADIALLGDGISRVRVGDVFYDRFCDPVMEVAEGLNLDHLHLEPSHRYPIPRHRPSYRIQPRLDALWLSSRLRNSAPKSRFLPGFGDFRKWLAHRGISISLSDPGRLHHLAGYVRLMTNWFKQLLVEVGATVALGVDYGPVSRAWFLAASELVLPSAEIQHGAGHPGHWAYSDWRALPEGGYPELPKEVWAWSKQDADWVNAWGAPHGHTAVPVGNLWLEAWLRDDRGIATTHDSIPRRLAEGAEQAILVSLSGGFDSPALLAPIARAIRESPAGYAWWVRAHPTMSQHEVRAAHMALGISDEQARVAKVVSDQPLYALLRWTDLHITARSSVIVEAAAFGVPSITTMEQTERIYRVWVPPELLRSSEDVSHAVAVLPPRRKPNTGSPRPSTASSELRRLIELGRRTDS